MPQLLHDLIAQALAEASDIHVVDASAGVPVCEAARQAHADVIVVAGGAQSPTAEVASLLGECPRASVVLVVDAQDADAIVRYELWPRAVDVGRPPTAERLVGALRGATPWAERFVTATGLVR
jgi:hypothetical protein